MEKERSRKSVEKERSKKVEKERSKKSVEKERSKKVCKRKGVKKCGKGTEFLSKKQCVKGKESDTRRHHYPP